MTNEQYNDYLSRRPGSFYGEMGLEGDRRLKAMQNSPGCYQTGSGSSVSHGGGNGLTNSLYEWYSEEFWPFRMLYQLENWLMLNCEHRKINFLLLCCGVVGALTICLLLGLTGLATGILTVIGAFLGWTTVGWLHGAVFFIRQLIATLSFVAIIIGIAAGVIYAFGNLFGMW